MVPSRLPSAPRTPTGRVVEPACRAAATLPSPPSASGRSLEATPAASRPCPMAVATSRAVREPLNLSGATRTGMSGPPCHGDADGAESRVRLRCGDGVGGWGGAGGLLGDLVDFVQRRDVVAAEDAAGAVAVQGLVPVGDEQGGDGVAAEVHQRAAL